MLLTLNCSKKMDKALLFALEKFPLNLKNDILAFLIEKKIDTVNEIRIRCGAYASLLINKTIIKTGIYIKKEQVDEIILNLCNGSVYAHIHTIKEGYISVGKGIRAGVCGKAVLKSGEIDGVYDISSINLRIPQRIHFAGDYLFNLLKDFSFSISVLLYSAPGVGKTTILRELLLKLSKFTTVRHAIIDSREEITTFIDDIITSDIYAGYPKGVGIELATKSMTPQIIICDEIASINDAQSITLAANSGVNLIATTHARDFEELKRKESLAPIFKNNIFDYAVGVTRNPQNKFVYTLDKLK